MKKKIVPITVVIPLILIVLISVLILIVGKILEKKASNNAEISLEDYYKVPKGEARLIIDIIKMDENALIRNKIAYLPLKVAEKMMPRIYYDVLDDVILYTTGTEKFVFKADMEEYEVNGKTQKG